MKALSRSFYRKDTVMAARNLLGKVLVRRMGRSIRSGIIVETEAYRFDDDPASHAFRGRTYRNRAMFEQVGCAYVYFTYGMHYCMNVVARDNSKAAGAVLIRALKPVLGIEIMVKRRGAVAARGLANGPGKLTQALDITTEQYGEDLTVPGVLFICGGDPVKDVMAGPRIGVRSGTDLMWNFKVLQ